MINLIKRWKWGIAVLILLTAILVYRGWDKPEPALNVPVDQPKLSMVTDSQALAELWENYILDAIPTICNQPFANADQINRDNAIQYGIWTMVRQGAYQQHPNGTGTIDPQKLSWYIKQYLNIDLGDIDPQQDFVFTAFYDIKTNTFDISEMKSAQSNYRYEEVTPWGIKLDSVSYDGLSRQYSIKLVHFATAESKRITRTTTCILQKRPDGTMYFISIQDEYPDTENLIKIDGTHQKIDADKLGISSADLQGALQVMKVYDHKLFIRTDNGKQGGEYFNVIRVYDENTWSELASFSSPEQFLAVKAVPAGFLLFGCSSVIHLDRQLRETGTSEIPLMVHTEAFRDDWWGGMDISEDGRYFVYSSQQEGLMLYDSQTKSSRRLAQHLPETPENSNVRYIPYIQGPAFVDNDSKVVARITGYESIAGYIMVDLESRRTANLAQNDYAFNNIYSFDGDQPASLGVFSRTENPDGSGHRNTYITILDHGKMEITESQVITTAENQNNPLYSEIAPLPLYNDKYLVYVVEKYSSTGDIVDNMYHIVRVDLNSMEAETILSIKAGTPTLLALLEDGRILFSYSFENFSGLAVSPGSKNN